MDNYSEPDWYADPTGIHHRRYWDGAQWTAHVSDRFGVMSAHHLQDAYPPPHERVEPVVEPVVDTAVEEPAPVTTARAAYDDAPKSKRARWFARRPREDAEAAPDVGPDTAAHADLGTTTEAETHAGYDQASDDALMLAAQVLQGACEKVGFSWRDSDMTIDDAINALPVDIADNTVGMMNRLFNASGDTENAAWTAEKLREIKLLKRGYRKLHELVTSTPTEEVFERSRSFGVPDDLTRDFVEGVLSSEIPTVAELQMARLPVGGPDGS